MPRRKRSKLKTILSDIEKILAEHIEQTIIHPSKDDEAPKKKRVKSTRKRKTTTVTTEDLLAMWKDGKKERPIDF